MCGNSFINGGLVICGVCRDVFLVLWNVMDCVDFCGLWGRIWKGIVAVYAIVEVLGGLLWVFVGDR